MIEGTRIHPLIAELVAEVERQDGLLCLVEFVANHGEGEPRGPAMLIAAAPPTKGPTWERTRAETLQIAAGAIRALRDAF